MTASPRDAYIAARDARDLRATLAAACAHRGTSLADIAARTAAPGLRARLLLADAFIDYIVFHDRDRAAESVHRALATDPTLAYAPLRAQFLTHMSLAEAAPADQDAALPPRGAW